MHHATLSDLACYSQRACHLSLTPWHALACLLHRFSSLNDKPWYKRGMARIHLIIYQICDTTSVCENDEQWHLIGNGVQENEKYWHQLFL